MDLTTFLIQCLNSVQYGLPLALVVGTVLAVAFGWLAGSIAIGNGMTYPVYRLAVFPLLPEPIGGKFHTEMLALVIGALVMRTQGIYFIMVTLAFAQLVFFVFHDTSIAGWQWIDLEQANSFYWFVLGALALRARADRHQQRCSTSSRASSSPGCWQDWVASSMRRSTAS